MVFLRCNDSPKRRDATGESPVNTSTDHIYRSPTRSPGQTIGAILMLVLMQSVMASNAQALDESFSESFIEQPSENQNHKQECKPDTPAALKIPGCSKMLGSDEVDPKLRVRVYTMRGYAWLTEEEPIAAVSDFSRAIELDASNVSALKGRARAHEILKQYDKAIEDWSSLVAHNPEDPDFLRERGYAHHLAGQYELAVADFTHVLTAIDDKNLDSLVGRAQAFEKLGRFEETEADFETALKINEKYIAAYIARGAYWERRRATNKAIDDYQTALRLNSINLHVRQALQRLGMYWVYP